MKSSVLKYLSLAVFSMAVLMCNTARGDTDVATDVNQERAELLKEWKQLYQEKLELSKEREKLNQEKLELLHEKEKLQEILAERESKKAAVAKEETENNLEMAEKTKDCQWPRNKDGSCMKDWNDVMNISCDAGYFNKLKEGWDGTIGNISYEEAVNLVCQTCSEGHYCPGDGFQYDCLTATKTGATECPKEEVAE